MDNLSARQLAMNSVHYKRCNTESVIWWRPTLSSIPCAHDSAQLKVITLPIFIVHRQQVQSAVEFFSLVFNCLYIYSQYIHNNIRPKSSCVATAADETDLYIYVWRRPTESFILRIVLLSDNFGHNNNSITVS